MNLVTYVIVYDQGMYTDSLCKTRRVSLQFLGEIPNYSMPVSSLLLTVDEDRPETTSRHPYGLMVTVNGAKHVENTFLAFLQCLGVLWRL